MSYHEWTCDGYMFPATRKNMENLGIDYLSLFSDPEDDVTSSDDWEEVISQAGYDNTEIKAHVNGKTFTVWFVHISSDVAFDEGQEVEGDTYIKIAFEDLYTTTPLFSDLAKLGMDEYHWVEGG